MRKTTGTYVSQLFGKNHIHKKKTLSTEQNRFVEFTKYIFH